MLIRSIPEALAVTERVCSSVNLGSTKTGINMDAVKLMGEIVLATRRKTKEQDSLGCAKLVVFCNAPDDNPFMAGAFHGVTEAECHHQCGRQRTGCCKDRPGRRREERILRSSARPSRRRRLRSREWDSWWLRRPPDAEISRSASSICPLLRLRLSATVSLRFWKRSVWSVQALRERQRLSPC